MTFKEVMAFLKANGSETTKRTLMRHGAHEPFYGVKVEHLKKIQKKVKKNHKLALVLYDTGNSDAMYLAGLIAESMKMTKAQLNKWVKGAYWYMLSCFTVPWTASSSKFAVELAHKWMDSKQEQVAACGWSTYSSYVSITPDDKLDLDEIRGLLQRVEKDVHTSMNRVKYTMVMFVISVAAYVAPLLKEAKAVAKSIGKVDVDMGDTSCKVPFAPDYIAKIESMGRVGKKRKDAFC